jgi:hypothetical protein
MLDRMMWCTQALAQPAETQISLFPAFVEVADELALSWEEAFQELQSVKERLTAPQLTAVLALDENLASISGPAHADLWKIQALSDTSEWKNLRQRAVELLEAMAWPNVTPSPNGDLYVGL